MAKPVSGALSTQNKARNATVVATSGNATLSLYPAANLTDPERTRRWRTAWSDTTSDTARVVMDLGSDTSPGIFSLIDCNASSGRVRLYGADDSSLTTNVIYYDFDLYDAGDSGAHVFYPQASGGTSGSKDGVRWASSTLVANFTSLDGTTPGSSAATGYFSPLVGDDKWGPIASYIGSSYFLGIPPLKPSTIERGQFTLRDGTTTLADAVFWGQDLPLAQEYQGTGVRGQPGSSNSTAYGSPIYWYMPYARTYDAARHRFASVTGEPFSYLRLGGAYNVGMQQDISLSIGNFTFCATVGFRVATGQSNNNLSFWNHYGASTGSLADSDNGIWYDRTNEQFRWYHTSTENGGPSFVAANMADSSVVDGAWHTLTVTQQDRAGGKVRFYFDGVEVGTEQSRTVVNSNTESLRSRQFGAFGLPGGSHTGDDNPCQIDVAFMSNADHGYAFGAGHTEAELHEMALLSQAEARYHLGLSTDTLNRRYWAIDFHGVTKLGTTSHLEIGAVWLGDRRDIEVQAGASVNLSDPSKLAQSYGGTVYLDRQTPFRTANVSVEQLTLANAYALQSELATAGGREVILDLHAASSDATLRDSGAIYGRAGASPASATLSSGSGSTVSLQIAESRK
jgi:hypothetical protein